MSVAMQALGVMHQSHRQFVSLLTLSGTIASQYADKREKEISRVRRADLGRCSQVLGGCASSDCHPCSAGAVWSQAAGPPLASRLAPAPQRTSNHSCYTNTTVPALQKLQSWNSVAWTQLETCIAMRIASRVTCCKDEDATA